MGITDNEKAIYQRTISFLENGELLLGLNTLDPLLNNLIDWKYRSRKEEIESNYQLLLKYLQDGMQDNKRQELYYKFIRQSLSLTDNIYTELSIPSSNSEYFQQLRIINQRNLSLEILTDELNKCQQEKLFASMTSESISPQMQELSHKIENLTEDIFNLIWVSGDLTETEIQIIKTFLSTASNDITAKCIVISALMLAVLCHFDENKILLLITAIQNQNPEISERGLVGIILIFLKYSKRMNFYPTSLNEWGKIKELPNIEKELTQLQMVLLNTVNVKNVEQKLNEEILPNLYKNQQSGIDLSKIDELMNDDIEESELINNEMLQNLQEQLEEINQMQQDGVDMPFVTFSHLKNYEFFNTVKNWFLPFSTDHTKLQNNKIVQSSLFQTFMQVNALCDSDMFSFSFTLQKMPEFQLEMIEKGIKAQFGDDINNNPLPKVKRTREMIQRMYVQDCYRFFTLFKKSHEISNPFDANILLTENKYLAKFLENKEQLLKIAYLAIKNKSWEQAAAIFKYIDEKYNLPADALQLYGFCLQKLKNYVQATICYEKAIIIDNKSKWTMNHLGFCLLQTGNIQKALKIYSQLCILDPENKTTLLHYAECLSLAEKYEQALTQFFKLEYLIPESKSAFRGIAWCSLQSFKANQANKYYNKLLQNEVSAQDLRNAGHATWADGNINKAIKLYKQAKITDTNNNTFTFTNSEIELLKQYGIDKTNILFVRDIVNQE